VTSAGILARQLGTVTLDEAIDDALSDQRPQGNHLLTDQPPSFSMRVNEYEQNEVGLDFCSVFDSSPQESNSKE